MTDLLRYPLSAADGAASRQRPSKGKRVSNFDLEAAQEEFRARKLRELAAPPMVLALTPEQVARQRELVAKARAKQARTDNIGRAV